MRLPLLITLAALSLGACGRNAQTENVANAEEGLGAESIVSNDVTAIDAVTGDASNIAADVNFTTAMNAATGSEGEDEKMPTPRKPAPGKPSLETPTPAEPVTNNAA